MKSAHLFRSIIGASLLSTCTTIAHAIPMVSIEPATSFGSIGDTIFVDIFWDGDGANYIGDWDIDLSYDQSVVSYSGSIFHFGVDSWGCIVCGDHSTAGVIDLFEVSLDSVEDLIANQNSLGNSFKLATLEFVGIADGISPLQFGNAGINFGTTFGDESGNAITPDISGGRICIGDVNCTVRVPEPTTLSILLIGLASLAIRRKQRFIQTVG